MDEKLTRVNQPEGAPDEQMISTITRTVIQTLQETGSVPQTAQQPKPAAQTEGWSST